MILQIEAIKYRCKHEADLKIDCLMNIRHSTEVLCMKFSVAYLLVYVILYLYIFIYNGWAISSYQHQFFMNMLLLHHHFYFILKNLLDFPHLVMIFIPFSFTCALIWSHYSIRKCIYIFTCKTSLQFEMARSYLQPTVGGTIVDASCGSGMFSRLFSQSGMYSHVVALDFSENMLRQCDEFIKKDNIPTEYYFSSKV